MSYQFVRKSISLVFCSCCLLLQAACVQNTLTLSPSDSAWYDSGAATVEAASRRNYNNTPGAARNIILFLGDGMGVATVTAARIYAGQQQGLTGEEYQLSFERFPWAGLVKTYNTDAQVPDSAGTMTAIMTGVKTRAGVIGIDGRPAIGSCEEYMNTEGSTLTTALELAEIAGKRTGIVSTATITHATPAATFANVPERNWEGSQNVPEDARALGCTDIASQLIAFKTRLETKVNGGRAHPNIDGIDVALGGGRNFFFGEDPPTLDGFAEQAGEGRRDDGRNLIREWTAQGGRYVMDQAGFDALDVNNDSPVLGLFEASHLRYEANRGEDVAGEPSLTDLTLKAIDLLDDDRDGFFLMVEGGRIDHAHHSGNAYNALNETAELSRAVAAALEKVDLNETLVIVTADHSHVMTIGGYPDLGNPILGIAGNDRDGLPFTTLSYANGSGFDADSGSTNAGVRSGPPAPGRHDLTGIDTTVPGFHQESLVGTFGETHGGEDVGIYAIGPGAHLVSGSIEQNVIFHIMNYAGDLENRAAAALE